MRVMFPRGGPDEEVKLWCGVGPGAHVVRGLFDLVAERDDTPDIQGRVDEDASTDCGLKGLRCPTVHEHDTIHARNQPLRRRFADTRELHTGPCIAEGGKFENLAQDVGRD